MRAQKYLAQRWESGKVVRPFRRFDTLAEAIAYAGDDFTDEASTGAMISGPDGRCILTAAGDAPRRCGHCGETIWYDGHDRRCGCID